MSAGGGGALRGLIIDLSLYERKGTGDVRTRGRVFHVERMAYAKALWWEQAYCI